MKGMNFWQESSSGLRRVWDKVSKRRRERPQTSELQMLATAGCSYASRQQHERADPSMLLRRRRAQAKESRTCSLLGQKRDRGKSTQSERQREAAGRPTGRLQEEQEDRKSTNPHPQPRRTATR